MRDASANRPAFIYLWQTNSENCEDFLSWQDLLTAVWETGDSYAFIFRFEAAEP